MINLILKAVPWGTIFELSIKAVLYFIGKAEDAKEMKRDFLKFVEAFHEHRQIPVKMNKKWAALVKKEMEEVEGQPYSEI